MSSFDYLHISWNTAMWEDKEKSVIINSSLVDNWFKRSLNDVTI